MNSRTSATSQVAEKSIEGGKVKCLCSKEGKLKFVKGGFHIMECSCGIVYVKEIRPYSGKISPVFQYERTIKDDKRTFRNRIKLLKKYLLFPPCVLDIGCSVGTFMREMIKEGWQADGIDVDEKCIPYCGGKVRIEDFDTAQFSRVYDLAIMNDFIEHISSPMAAIRKVHSLLKAKGLLFITTPNIDSLAAKASGVKWLHLKPKEHLWYFTPKTIKRLLTDAGFDTLWCGSIGRVRNLKTLFWKSRTYTNLFYKFAWGENIAFNFNIGDEMGVIAKRK